MKIRLANPNRRRDTIEVSDALVDTGATFTTLPRELARRLQLDVLNQRRIQMAGGEQTIDQSFAYFDYDGRQTVTPVWISDTYPGVLIGVITFEALGLAVDPSTGRLTNSQFLLLVSLP